MAEKATPPPPIPGPNIVSATRVNGAWIDVRYEAGASGYTKVYVFVRVTGTSNWAQATSSTTMNGMIVVSTIGGTPLDAKVAYDVQMQAAVGSKTTEKGNIVKADPWKVATPNLLSATRISGERSQFNYSQVLPAGGGNPTVYVETRQLPSGNFGQVTSFPAATASGSYTASTPNARAGYEIRIRVGQWGVYSDYSSTRSVSEWKTPAPGLLAATRTSDTRVDLTYEKAVTGSVGSPSVRIERRETPGGSWTTAATWTPSSSAGKYSVTVPSGLKSYEFRITNLQWGVYSDPSTTRSVDAWWSLPPSPTDLRVARITAGTSSLTWSATATTQAPITGWRIWRAEGEAGRLKLLATIDGAKRTYHDPTAKPEVEYRYGVESYNQAGDSSSRPTVTAKPTLFVPNAPTAAPAVTYVATNKAKVEWALNVAAGRPYTGQRVLMRDAGKTAWTAVATVGAAVVEATITIGANRVVEFAIEPYNSAGPAESVSPTSAKVATVPAAPPSLAAKWDGGSSIVASWAFKDAAGKVFTTIGNAIDVQFSTEAGTAAATWYDGTTPSAPLPVAATGSWKHTSVSTIVPHWYRMRVRRTDIAGAPTSGWVYSAQVAALTKPKPPTMVRPEVIDAATVVRLAFVHQPVDGTDQTLAKVQYRKQGTTTWTIRTVGTATYYDLAPGSYSNGDVLEVQAQTAGASGVYSDWSSTMVVALRARITTTILTPTPGVWASSSLLVGWSAPGQVSALVELIDTPSAAVIDTRTVTTGTSVVFEGVSDRGRYTVRVTARDAYQDGVPASVQVSIVLDRPAPPIMSATWRPTDASTLLLSRPMAGLKVLRRNVMPPLAGGTNGGPITSRPVSLRRPDDTFIEAVQLETSTAGTGWQWTALAAAGTSEKVGATLLLTTLGGAQVEAQVQLIDGASTLATVHVQAPVWPDAIPVQMPPATTSGTTALVVSLPQGGALVVAQAGIIATSLPDVGGYFDEYTEAEGVVYRRLPTGVVEASESLAGDLPTAPMVRVQYWRWDAVDDEWRPIGDGGDDWSLRDYIPPVGVVLRYRARGYAAGGGWADSAAVELIGRSRDVHLNHGDGWAGHVSGGKRDISGTGRGRRIEVTQYADHDFASVARSARLTPGALSLAVQLLPSTGVSSYAQWVKALGTPGDVVYREPGGLVMRGGAQLGKWAPHTRYREEINFDLVETGVAHV